MYTGKQPSPYPFGTELGSALSSQEGQQAATQGSLPPLPPAVVLP